MKQVFFGNSDLRILIPLIMGLFAVCSTSCKQIERPKIEPFYAATSPPRIQELRWSNGKSPRSMDPAKAAAPPETDLVRAVFEGLTELDSRTLEAVPATASSWQSTKDHRTWTFNLRRGAKWSNGESVTAHDFVRSWKRLSELGEQTPNSHLFQHIIGMNTWDRTTDRPGGETIDFLRSTAPEAEVGSASPTPTRSPTPASPVNSLPTPSPTATRSSSFADGRPSVDPAREAFGVVAVDDHVLRVTLRIPDKDFPKLVAHPIFRPVFGSGSNFGTAPLDLRAPTNGPFRLTKIDEGSLTLERSETYWNRAAISLAQIRMISADTAEAALQAYRRGDVDVVTNAMFEPVAVKLLAPFDDFRRMSYNALNFYEINTGRHPFNDRRVRQALSLAVDREKLADGDLQGTTQPAYAFSPLIRRRTDNLLHDAKKAAELLENAGYPAGEGFPPIRLVINRNDVQQRVAASVARMWKQNLNINCVVVVKETSEMDEVRRSGDFDIIRRGVVLPSNDDTVNLAAVNGRIDVYEDREEAVDAAIASNKVSKDIRPYMK